MIETEPQDEPVSPARRMGRPSRAQAELLHGHILDIAEGLFLAKGFEGTSMDVLAVEARASKRTIYHRYPNKTALFAAVIERVIARLVDGARAEVTEGTREARLEHLALTLVDRVLRPDTIALMRVVIAESHRFTELARSVDRRARERVEEIISEVLRADDLPRTGTAPAATAMNATLFCNLTESGLMMRALMGGDMEEIRAEAPAMIGAAVQLFLNGAPREG